MSGLASAPQGSELGLGCGNPTAIASIQPGETVVDLGSGAGFDCFLAARRAFINDWIPGQNAGDFVASANITGRKPKR